LADHRQADDFTELTYSTKAITIVPGIGEAGKSIAYVRKRDPSIDVEPHDQFNTFIALSSRCMHLGCPVRYVEAAEEFICPCHGGVYNFRGEVAGGPPVRPLDRFYTLVRNGYVYLGPRYSVNSELQRFAPRDPGQPLDGIGQYLYPSRFDTSKLPPTKPPAIASDGARDGLLMPLPKLLKRPAPPSPGQEAPLHPIDAATEAGLTVVDWIDERTQLSQGCAG